MMQVNIFFSVIIPAYNAELFIADAIESVLAQKVVNYEVIVVDDGSTDSTLEIISRFGSQIKLIAQQNSGVAIARNNGAKAASGNYLAFLDSDDTWLPNKLIMQLQKIMAGFKMVYSNRYNFGQTGDLPLLQSDIISMKEGDIWNELLIGNVITTSSVVINKQIFEENGGFSPDLPPCEDWDLWLKCSSKYNVGYCSEPLTRYRFHSGGISRNYLKMSRMRQKVIDRAMQSERASELSTINKRKIYSGIWANSGWEAAVDKNILMSLKFYYRALCYWPLNFSLWYDIARVVAGRA